MRVQKALIDSLNLSFDDNEVVNEILKSGYYCEEVLKDTSERVPPIDPKKRRVLNKIYTKRAWAGYSFISILHTHKGVNIVCKCRIVRATTTKPKRYVTTFEFAGMYSYTEKGVFLKQELKRFIGLYGDKAYISRLDIAMDFKDTIPPKIINNIVATGRKISKVQNTTYFKSPKEKKINSYINIYIYDKAKKEKLKEPIKRLEYSFTASYCKNTPLNKLEELTAKAVIKIERDIKFNSIKLTQQSLK